MKKKLAVITIIMAMLLCICSCGSKIPTPTETADSFLTALKEQDNETLPTVYSGGSLDLLEEASEAEDSGEVVEDTGLTRVFEEQMIPKMLDFDYEISNEKIDGEKAAVDVKFTTCKIGDAFTAFFGEYITQAFVLAFSDASEKDLDSMATTILSGKLADLSEKNYEKTATLSLTMVDGKWMVDEIKPGDEVIDGLTGGLMTAFGNLAETFSDWEE